MKDKYIIRKAIFADAADMADIVCRAWHKAFSDFIPADELAQINITSETAMFEDVLKNDKVHNFVAIDGTKPCGLCAIAKSRDEDLKSYGEIIAIHTKPEYWGKGVGKLLMDTALSELKSLGFDNIMLWTFEKNERARRFYEKYRFYYDGTIKDSGIADAKEVRYRLEL